MVEPRFLSLKSQCTQQFKTSYIQTTKVIFCYKNLNPGNHSTSFRPLLLFYLCTYYFFLRVQHEGIFLQHHWPQHFLSLVVSFTIYLHLIFHLTIRGNLFFSLNIFKASLVAQTIKTLPAVQEAWVQSPVKKIPWRREMETHSSMLAWRIPWTEESGRLQSMGSQKSLTGLSN